MRRKSTTDTNKLMVRWDSISNRWRESMLRRWGLWEKLKTVLRKRSTKRVNSIIISLEKLLRDEEGLKGKLKWPEDRLTLFEQWKLTWCPGSRTLLISERWNCWNRIVHWSRSRNHCTFPLSLELIDDMNCWYLSKSNHFKISSSIA